MKKEGQGHGEARKWTERKNLLRLKWNPEKKN